MNEIPSRHVLEKHPKKKASILAFIHLKLMSNLQGFCQYIMAYMLNLTIADYKKIFRSSFSRPLKLIFLMFSQFSINPHIPRV